MKREKGIPFAPELEKGLGEDRVFVIVAWVCVGVLFGLGALGAWLLRA